jgi:hypothetical protein
MKKKNYVECSNCILCDTCYQESVMQLFFEFSFGQSFWCAIGIEWNTDYDGNNMITESKEKVFNGFLDRNLYY